MSSSAISGPIFTDNKRAPAGTAAAPSFAFNDSTGTGVYLVSAGVLGLSTNGAQRVVVDASGNVGIGTASPTSKLTVSGTNARIAANDPAGPYFVRLVASNSFAYTGIEYKTLFTFSDDGTERMRLDGLGRFLVGTTTVGVHNTTTTGLNYTPGSWFSV